MSLLWVYYHGNVDIAYWEWALAAVYLIVLYTMFARQKNMNIKKHPEYRFYLWGLISKIVGGVAFSLIYFYYYEGGDTIAYFYSAVSMSRLAETDPNSYFTVLFGANDLANLSLFNETIGYPYSYVYFDTRSFFLIRLISPLVMLTFHSYLITTVVLASISYVGVWRCYRTFVNYFPSLTNKLAIAFLFMPSVVFWGSAIMKDTMTLSAACWWLHCWDELVFKRRRMTFNIAGLAVSMFLLIMMKPYIFMALFPVSLFWLLYFRVSRIRSILVKFVLLPLIIIAMASTSLYVLTKLGDSLDKFSLDKVIATIQTTQSDMVRVDAYGSNRFDVGPIDGTITGLLSKFPIATNAALFRPYLWESRSIVMLLSALENFWLLAFTVLMLFRTRVRFFLRALFGNPIVLMCFSFVVLFGFFIGISTPNFGALVRFKIPLVPLFVSGLYIVDFLNRRRVQMADRGLPFDLTAYSKGEPGSIAQQEALKGGSKRRDGR
ncbi:MAG: hypothetical protein IPG92_09715 [Flavobacteriales bacterium]|nr:hypothetical protein [Flavobacteriales bacterium]